jgi:hypothetical protein
VSQQTLLLLMLASDSCLIPSGTHFQSACSFLMCF